MRQEIFEKAKKIYDEIEELEYIIRLLREPRKIRIGEMINGINWSTCISQELQEFLLSSCETRLEKLKQEFEKI